MGNFGEVFYLANWLICGESPILKPAKFKYAELRNVLLRFVHALAIGRSVDRQIYSSAILSGDRFDKFNARQMLPLYGIL